MHPNHEVYDKVIKILETYFNASEEESIAAIAPANTGAAFQFGGAAPPPGPGGPGAPGVPPGGGPGGGAQFTF